MEVQIGELEKEEVIGEGIGESEMDENEIDEETKGVDSRDKVKHDKIGVISYF